MQKHRHSHVIKLSSDRALGAFNVSDGAGTFSVDLSREFIIPLNAENPQIHCHSALVWYSTPNVLNTTGFEFSFTDRRQRIGAVDNAGDLMRNATLPLFVNEDGEWVEGTPEQHCTVTIRPPTGLYTPSDIGRLVINSQLVEAFDDDGFNGAVSLTGEVSTGRVTVELNRRLTSLTITGPDMRRLLGFPPGELAHNSANRSAVRFSGTDLAALRPSRYYYISCSLADSGMQVPTPTSNGGQRIIARIPILVSPGTQIHYEPINPPEFSCASIVDHVLRQADVSLLDDRMNPVDTAGYDWSINLVVTYYM